MKVLKVIGATICGFLIFAIVFSLALLLMALIIGWVSNIPVIGKILLWLGTGGNTSSDIAVAWYLYFFPMSITSFLMLIAMGKICGTDYSAYNIAKKIVGITIIVIYVLSAIINLIVFFMGDEKFFTVIVDVLFVIFGSMVAFGDD